MNLIVFLFLSLVLTLRLKDVSNLLLECIVTYLGKPQKKALFYWAAIKALTPHPSSLMAAGKKSVKKSYFFISGRP